MTFEPDHDAPFTETGKAVYERTYSRVLSNGEMETWAQTVERVVVGNLKLVYGEPATWAEDVKSEYQSLCEHIYDMRIIPGGRHLWATGVGKRQYLSNCHNSSWGAEPCNHFEFSFMRLMEGGGVGTNYSSRYLTYGPPRTGGLEVHVVCDVEHPDYMKMFDANLLSTEYVSEWSGCYQVPDNREGWADALGDFIDTFWRNDVAHTKRVYDVSIVRPEGSKLHTFGGTASGPLPLAQMLQQVCLVLNQAYLDQRFTPIAAMEMDHEIAQCVVAGGVRRSARMSILHWNDPYIFDFINCKSEDGSHWTTNISVEIDDDFIAGLEDPFSHASAVHSAVVAGMLRNGEPGYWNSSLSNVGEVQPVESTNPCGEIALNPWDVCNLGHVNLEAFAGRPSRELEVAHRLIARFLIRATFGDFTDETQAEVVKRNRRIGVGHFGVQGYLTKSGIRYSDAPKGAQFPALLRTLSRVVREAADEYAFQLRIPSPIKTTTVAPTGTIAKMPGATEGIHSVYAKYFIHRMRFSTLRPEERAQVQSYVDAGYLVEPCIYAANTMVVSIPTKNRLVDEVQALGYNADLMVESADEISIKDALAFQAMYQSEFADNAVSHTVNFDPDDLSPAYAQTVIKAFLPHLKGLTLMPDGSRQQAPYERITREQYEAYDTVSVEDATDLDCASGACPIR